jgi:hypothetical protein
MADETKQPLHSAENTEDAIKKPWQPMKLTIAGEAKDVIRHGVNKSSPGTGDPGEINKVPGQAEH